MPTARAGNPRKWHWRRLRLATTSSSSQPATRARSPRSGSSLETRALQRHAPQPQGVGNYRHRAETHGGGSDHRAEKNAEGGIQDARGNRHADRVVEEGEEQVLPDVRHRRAAQPPRAQDAAQVALDERDARSEER